MLFIKFLKQLNDECFEKKLHAVIGILGVMKRKIEMILKRR